MWRRPRLVNRGHETPGPRPGRCARLRGAFAPGAGRQCRRRKRTLADSATVERREAASRLRGRAHASQAWRRALRARHVQGWRLSALRHPLAGRGSKMKDRSPGRRKRRGSEESCGSTRIAVRKIERVVAGTSDTGLFDIVNRGSTALPETSVLGPAQHWWIACGGITKQRAPTLPLVGRVDRRSEAKAGGVGVVVVARGISNNNDPHPQPLPTRGRGADRVCSAFVRQTRN